MLHQQKEAWTLGRIICLKVFLLDVLRKILNGGSEYKESACNVGDSASIPGVGRSPGEGNGNPLQYSYLENIKDGAWQATQLNDFTLFCLFFCSQCYLKIFQSSFNIREPNYKKV